MRSLRWTDDHSIFIEEFDREHRGLFQIMQELRHGVLTNEPAEKLEFLVGRLSRKIAAHFSHEERMMRVSRYGAQTWHEQQHQAGRIKVATLREALSGGGPQSVFEALEEVANWTIDHVSVADRMLGAHIRNYGRERVAC